MKNEQFRFEVLTELEWTPKMRKAQNTTGKGAAQKEARH